ncbi:MAG: FAD/NAD(P)-binding oxidoreductase [Chloroflexi bacterium HGW-Chloroflexi-4]|jgi:glycerol-3-phosphate dehydrogenase|nr:MAG: FAD/NAD(P)-binding oxidoreductase [Chloroflexi bacterium HGW-Chloroflexi-4]
MKNYDIIIIGGGVIGCMTARALSRFDLKVLLIEQESDIGMGASSANSAIIHAGHDPMPGSLKAEMNRIANPMWDQISTELGISFRRCGAYIVAIGEDEFGCLTALKERSDSNGVTSEIISAEEMRRREPLVNPAVSGALFTPTAGMVDPFAACVASIENAIQNGVEVLTETAFTGFIMEGKTITGIHTNQGDFACRWVVNAAGTYSDEVMHAAETCQDFKITPRRGEYYLLDKAEIEMNNILFPVPSAVSKGILVLGSTHGNVLVGPNSQSTEDKENKSVTSEGLAEIWQGAQKLVPSISPRSVIAMFAGLRATGNAACLTPGVNYNNDFVIERSVEVNGLINLAGIESPGLTAAPAIAQRVIELLQDSGETLIDKQNWNPIRPARPHFNHMNREEQADLVAKDPRYGRIVCRCEMITEGEIIAEIHAPLPARTYDAIKRRTWLGTGRCLGSFDMPRVVDILAHELNLPATAISKKGAGSEFLQRQTKEVEA